MYQQDEKTRARQSALSHAVSILTKERDTAAVVPSGYLAAVREHIVKNGTYQEKTVASELRDETIDEWADLRRAYVKTKSAAELKVCYLAGPEPENDFQVLIDQGIHPRNVWAFESDKRHYRRAVETLKQQGLTSLHLVQGDFSKFLQSTPKKFDIVYVDACGPLPSRSSKTLELVSNIFRYRRLESPGVLLTNFSTPDLSDPEQLSRYAFLVASYLYGKDFIEGYDADELNRALAPDGPLASGYGFFSHEEFETRGFYEEVKANFPIYYGQYVTRQILDSASFLMPWWRVASSYFWKYYFSEKASVVAEKYLGRLFIGGDVNSMNPTEAPLLWTFKWMEQDDVLKKIAGEKAARNLLRSWKQQTVGFPEPSVDAQTAITAMYLLRDELLSEERGPITQRFRNAVQNITAKFQMPFCDMPTPAMGFDVLVHQLGYPMNYSVDACRRWRYTAKETEMFMDALVFDECRYVYEWLPTVDLLNEALSNRQDELAFRFACDAIAKQRRWYNTEYFFGAAVVDMLTEGFRAKYLSPREVITIRPEST